MPRSVVFSSFNESVCAALNWKQPNFPVFLCNDLGKAATSSSMSSSELKDGREEESVVAAGGGVSTSIKDAVRTAQTNNLMGLICCERLLVCFPLVPLFHFLFFLFPLTWRVLVLPHP